MKKRTDIALFISNMETGGAELTLAHLAQGFTSRGLKVDLVLVRASGQNLKRVPSDVRIVDLDCAHTRSSIWKLASYLRRERPRALLSALDGPNVGAIIAKWLSGTKIRHAITINAAISLAYSPKNADLYTSRQWAKLTFRAMKILYRFANHVVAISSGVADDVANVAHIPRERIRVFYLPVITPTIYQRMIEPVNHPWFHTAAPPVIMAIGRLAAAKDYPTLIRAFSILRKKRSAHLLIIGEGELRPELEKLISRLDLGNEVSLPGYLENQYSYMAQASVFALSSAWEGLSMVLIEALACGARVISTDCDYGPSEILEKGKWGKLVPVGDSEALAQALEESLNGMASTLVPTEALDRFTLETVVNKYSQLLLD